VLHLHGAVLSGHSLALAGSNRMSCHTMHLTNAKPYSVDLKSFANKHCWLTNATRFSQLFAAARHQMTTGLFWLPNIDLQ